MNQKSSKTPKSSRLSPNLSKLLSLLLYFLPTLFFFICYFLIITSGEDIWQGANTPVNILGDSIAAFHHSVRLADMFAWSIINFFDYRYSFGLDTIFRLLDVFAALSVFYMSTYLVLKRRPRLRLPDASVFCGLFLAVFLTSNGLTLYAGFSKIHNYLFIAFFFLLFGIFYVRDLWGYKTPSSKLFCLFMFALGFLFGFSSNITAIVFLLTLPLYYFYLHFSQKHLKKAPNPSQNPLEPPSASSSCSSLQSSSKPLSSLKSFLLSWRFSGILGILLSLFIMYGLGSGIGDYDTNPVYQTVFDYLPLSALLSAPAQSLIRLIKHNIFNFARFLFPFFVATFLAFVSKFLFITPPLRLTKKSFRFLFSKREQNYLVASLIFIFLHILALSQIYYQTRLTLPAYLLGISIFFFVIKRLFTSLAPLSSHLRLLPLSLIFIFLTISIITLRSYFAISYLTRISPILEKIKVSDSSSLCVDKNIATAESLPYIHLGQEDFLVDWAMPQTIYEKSITYCE